MTNSSVILLYKTRSGRQVAFAATTTDAAEGEIVSVTGSFSLGQVLGPTKDRAAEVIEEIMLVNLTDTSDYCIVRDGEKNVQPVCCVGVGLATKMFKLKKPFIVTATMKVFEKGEGGAQTTNYKITVNIEFHDGSSDIYLVDSATSITALVDYRDGQALGTRHPGKKIVRLSGHAEAGCSQINYYDNEGIVIYVFTVPRMLTPGGGERGYVAENLSLSIDPNTTMKSIAAA